METVAELQKVRHAPDQPVPCAIAEIAKPIRAQNKSRTKQHQSGSNHNLELQTRINHNVAGIALCSRRAGVNERDIVKSHPQSQKVVR